MTDARLRRYMIETRRGSAGALVYESLLNWSSSDQFRRLMRARARRDVREAALLSSSIDEPVQHGAGERVVVRKTPTVGTVSS